MKCHFSFLQEAVRWAALGSGEWGVWIHARSGCLSAAGGFVRALWVPTLRELHSGDSSLSLSEGAAAVVTGWGGSRAGRATSSE